MALLGPATLQHSFWNLFSFSRIPINIVLYTKDRQLIRCLHPDLRQLSPCSLQNESIRAQFAHLNSSFLESSMSRNYCPGVGLVFGNLVCFLSTFKSQTWPNNESSCTKVLRRLIRCYIDEEEIHVFDSFI